MKKALTAVLATGVAAFGLEGQAGVIYSQAQNGSSPVGYTHGLFEEPGYTDNLDEDDPGLPPGNDRNGVRTLTADNFETWMDYRDSGSPGSTHTIPYLVWFGLNNQNPGIKFDSTDLSNFPVGHDIYFQVSGFQKEMIGDALKADGTHLYSMSVAESISGERKANLTFEKSGSSKPIPEPTTFALIGAGYAAYLGMRRGRERNIDSIAAGYETTQKSCNRDCGYDCH